jgi:hypothetical protein
MSVYCRKWNASLASNKVGKIFYQVRTLVSEEGFCSMDVVIFKRLFRLASSIVQLLATAL